MNYVNYVCELLAVLNDINRPNDIKLYETDTKNRIIIIKINNFSYTSKKLDLNRFSIRHSKYKKKLIGIFLIQCVCTSYRTLLLNIIEHKHFKIYLNKIKINIFEGFLKKVLYLQIIYIKCAILYEL